MKTYIRALIKTILTIVAIVVIIFSMFLFPLIVIPLSFVLIGLALIFAIYRIFLIREKYKEEKEKLLNERKPSRASKRYRW